jgi:hypothetical protein
VTFQPFVAGLGRTLLKNLPKYVGAAAKAVGKALWGWYSRLGFVAMLVTTAATGVIAFVTIEKLPLSASSQAELRNVVGGVLVVWLLAVIIIGPFRVRRGR